MKKNLQEDKVRHHLQFQNTSGTKIMQDCRENADYVNDQEYNGLLKNKRSQRAVEKYLPRAEKKITFNLKFCLQPDYQSTVKVE